jgi:SNF2 family DNA or RNA helicase
MLILQMNEFVKIAQYNIVPRVNPTNPLPQYELTLRKNKELCIVGLDYTLHVSDNMRRLLVSLLKDPSVSDAFKMKIYHKPQLGIWVKFYVSKQYINTVCDRYGLAPYILSTIIKQSGKREAMWIKSYTDAEIPIFNNPTNLICEYRKFLKIEPYDYQHNNINWLRQVEENIDSKLQYFEYVQTNDLLHLHTKRFNMYIDADTDILYNDDSLWRSEHRCLKYNIYGGVLCDEVGLGKTLSMTGLIISDKYHCTTLSTSETREVNNPTIEPVSESESVAESESKSESESELEPKSAKIKIKAKIMAKVKVSEPVKVNVKQQISIIKRDKPLEIEPVDPVDPLDPDLDLDLLDPNLNPNPIYTSNATLVMAPRRLVSQWITEINKYTNRLSVIEVSTMVHIKKYTYDDMKNVDVVVVSFSLLDNKNYLQQETFQLHDIKWRRTIIDEGHEVLLHTNKKRIADVRISQGIFSIQSQYRWVCTGTPLANTYESLQAILSYLNNLGYNESSSVLDNIDNESYQRLMNLIFHRNTRNSISTQISIPKHTETVEFLEFTDTERAIYDSIDSSDVTRKLQVCTNLSVSETDNEISGGNVLTLEESTKAMGGYYMGKCDRTEELLVEYKNKIDEIVDQLDEKVHQIESMIATCTDPDDMDELRAEKNRLKASARNRKLTLMDHIQTANQDLIKYRKQLQIFRSLDLDHIIKTTCPITGQKLNNKVAITPDGYYYSTEGLELLFLGGRKTTTCPLSRKSLDIDQIIFVDTNKKSTGVEQDIERSTWGTKMAHVLNKLRMIQRKDPEGKIIIFSQWNKMLILMAKALKSGNIRHVFCRGNVHMMSKSINLFKSDPNTRVILLSSDSCNSGSNLTEAGYVFLIDAVSGEIEKARAAETQAIARTCRLGQQRVVQVYRFVMKDTIENEYYHKLKLKS